MPFENNQAASALTRRSSRLRTAASEAPAAGATAPASEESATTVAPLSRRAARERLTSAQTLIVAAASVAVDGPASGEIEPVGQSDALTEVVEAETVAESVAEPVAELEAEPVAEAEAEPAVEPAPAAAAPIAAESVVADVATDDTIAVLAEPVAEPETVRAPRMASAPTSTSADAFEQASRTFRAVADESAPSESRVAEPAGVDSESEPQSTEHVARRRPKARKLVALGATVGVMSLAGLLAVSMTLPAEAVAAVSGGQAALSTSLVTAGADAEETGGGEQIQAFVASGEAQGEALTRAEDFSTVSLVELASEQGIKYSNDVFTNDPNAAIQWPFLVGVGMSSGFGQRWGRMHEGIDFVPGEGAPIQAIADGTVRIATEQGGGYGVTVYIDHVIDGQVVTSHYAHMQYGSLRVKAGQTVKVGDIVGLTGNTGHSFGAHLHFEIIINGTPVDPLPWLRKNAGRYSY